MHEEIYHQDIRKRYFIESIPEFIEAFIIIEARKFKQRCTSKKETRDDLIMKMKEYLHFHSLIQIYSENHENFQHDS